MSDVVPSAIRAGIKRALGAIEREERVGIVFAVESGSRAWGFPSPDSDWDVRFVYARRTEWHLQLQPGRDVIERSLPNDIDLAGWDVRKALNLLLAGNAALREWMRSPILYRSNIGLFDAFRRLAAAIPARRSAAYHYRRLAQAAVDKSLTGEGSVNLKKYLYALRPVLALRWLREYGAKELPMDLPGLLAGVTLDAATRSELDTLLAQKARASELGHGERRPMLDAMIASELAAAIDLAPEDTTGFHAAAQALMIRCTAWADSLHPVRDE